jgi:O-antigen/teichoic acid export membrane protein
LIVSAANPHRVESVDPPGERDFCVTNTVQIVESTMPADIASRQPRGEHEPFPASRWQTWGAFLVPKLHRVGEFLVAQGITLAGNLLYGLLCVRLLPIGGYAKFAVVFAYLGSLVLLMDIGISGSLVPLVGEKIDDRQLIADYVASLRQLAHRLFAVMAPATAVVFPLLVRKQAWGWQVVSAMVAILIVAAWCARVAAAYGTVLILRRDRARYYRAQMVSSLGTLTLLGVFWAAHWLNAWVAILLNVAGIVNLSLTYYFRARHLLRVRGNPSQQKRQAIVRLVLPNIPNVVFYAVQGQISLMLITIFGRTAGVASVGALGRLAQIFVILAQMNPLLIEPYFAKLAQAQLKKTYLGTLAAVGALCLGAVGLARAFPELFLWVLGPNYSHLRFEVLLVIAAGAIRHVSGLMWIIHCSRRFVYWWNNLTTIALTILVQAFFLWKTDLATVRSVLWFNIASALVSLLVNILCAFYGFWRGPRKIEGV